MDQSPSFEAGPPAVLAPAPPPGHPAGFAPLAGDPWMHAAPRPEPSPTRAPRIALLIAWVLFAVPSACVVALMGLFLGFVSFASAMDGAEMDEASWWSLLGGAALVVAGPVAAVGCTVGALVARTAEKAWVWTTLTAVVLAAPTAWYAKSLLGASLP